MFTGAPVPQRDQRSRSQGASSFRARVRVRLLRLGELFPLTLRGFAVAALSLGALLFYGFGALDGVWYVAGLGLLGLCALALIAVLIAALLLTVALRRQGAASLERVLTETGREVATGFELPRLRALVLIDLAVTAREPAAAELALERDGPRAIERVRLSDHGEWRTLARTIVVRDVFGVASLGLRRTQAIELDVLPHAGALRSLPLLRSLSGGDDLSHPLGIEQGDRLELRRYAPGDPARFIHWKVYARTQKLVVRMPERALSRAQRVAAYLVAGANDAASAAAARVALEEGAFGADFRFAADGSPAPTRDVASALCAIRRSSAAREQSTQGLTAFVQEVEREGPCSLVLFAPASEGAHLERIGEFLRKRGRPARVVIGVDGFLPEQPTSWWRRFERLALAPASSARIQATSLRAQLAAYRRFGCEVVLVDRESGRVLGEAHLRRREATEVAA